MAPPPAADQAAAKPAAALPKIETKGLVIIDSKQAGATIYLDDKKNVWEEISDGGKDTVMVGKREVNIDAIEPVGVYAVKLVFSDGHDTGIYSWEYLYDLGTKQDSNWKSYLARLAAAGKSREP